MARPQIIQQLRRGNILSQKNFPQFVETWNYSVNRLENIKGDADVGPQDGAITIDNTDPEHPVVRLKKDKLDVKQISPDDVSTEFIPHEDGEEADNSDEGKLQIKGWKHGTPTAATTLAQELESTGSTSTVITRTEDGTLYYMGIGQLSGGGPTTIDVDSEGDSDQKSIAWREDKELELYKMEEAGISVDTKLERVYDDDGGMNPPRLVGMGAVLPAKSIPDAHDGEQDVEFVIRRGGAGGEIDYAKVTLSAALSAFAISGDANEGQDWPQDEHAHRSVETKYNQETGNPYHQVYNFDDGTTQSEEIQLSAGVFNPILPQDPSQPYTYDFVMRRHDTHNFESEVDYLNMNLKMPPISGDSQIDGTHDYSMVGSYTADGAYKPMLYNWHGGVNQHVHVKTDGESYYWPQDTQTPSDGYFFLVKHQTTGGDWILEYKQLVVDMPDINIDGLTSDVNQIYSDLTVINGEIDYLSGVISAGLSGNYWESGGDNTTCYGSAIGDSSGSEVVGLDDKELRGSWSTGQHFWAGGNLGSGSGQLVLGHTVLTEAQLSALLQLVQAAPQLLRLV